jgi:hypothetical protein
VAKKRRGLWRAFVAAVERAVLSVMMSIVVAVVARQLRKRFR